MNVFQGLFPPSVKSSAPSTVYPTSSQLSQSNYAPSAPPLLPVAPTAPPVIPVLRQVIGEGSYGCVHKPSIECAVPPEPGFKYDGKVSKILKTEHAVNELNEYKMIDAADPDNKYHLGTPVLCHPKLDNRVLTNIDSCEHIKRADVEPDPSKYKLLIMKNGGTNLYNFTNNNMMQYLYDKTAIMNFYKEIQHLIEGLKLFKDKGLVHNDLKPQNIVIDVNTGQMRFIDFGLMRTAKEIKRDAILSNLRKGVFHWSYPPETGFLNSGEFNAYNALPVKDSVSSDINQKIIRTLKYFSAYIYPLTALTMTEQDSIQWMREFHESMAKHSDYKTFITDVVDSIDIYGLGFSLLMMQQKINYYGLIPPTLQPRAAKLFHTMCHHCLSERDTNIETVLHNYVAFLAELENAPESEFMTGMSAPPISLNLHGTVVQPNSLSYDTFQSVPLSSNLPKANTADANAILAKYGMNDGLKLSSGSTDSKSATPDKGIFGSKKSPSLKPDSGSVDVESFGTVSDKGQFATHNKGIFGSNIDQKIYPSDRENISMPVDAESIVGGTRRKKTRKRRKTRRRYK